MRLRNGSDPKWHPVSHKLVAREAHYVCEVCGLRWRERPLLGCSGLAYYSEWPPSDLVTLSEIVWLRLNRPVFPTTTVEVGNEKVALYSVSAAAAKAKPRQRRQVVVETFTTRSCRCCLRELPQREHRFGPHLCSLCEEERAPWPRDSVRLPSVDGYDLEELRGNPALAQLIEFEAKAAVERAEVAHALDQLELLETAAAEPHDLERIDRARDSRIAEATRLVERMRAWREERSVPELEAVDGAVVEHALKQGLMCLDRRDPVPGSPIEGSWPLRVLLVWLHYACLQVYGERDFENIAQIAAAREELRERLALLWWYQAASSVAAQEWLIVPTKVGGAKEISSVGRVRAQGAQRNTMRRLPGS